MKSSTKPESKLWYENVDTDICEEEPLRHEAAPEKENHVSVALVTTIAMLLSIATAFGWAALAILPVFLVWLYFLLYTSKKKWDKMMIVLAIVLCLAVMPIFGVRADAMNDGEDGHFAAQSVAEQRYSLLDLLSGEDLGQLQMFP